MATDTTQQPTEKNDLYAYLGDELCNESRGMSLGRLDRVRAAYEFCEFTVAGGERVRRDVSDVLNCLGNGYEFVEAEGEF